MSRYVITASPTEDMPFKQYETRFEGIEEVTDLLSFIFAAQTPMWVENTPWASDVMRDAVAWGIMNRRIGFTLVSEAMADEVVVMRPLPRQKVSSYFHGSVPNYGKADNTAWGISGTRERYAYMRCQNCDAFCQGYCGHDGCNMCEGEEGEIHKCDCWESGGTEEPGTCILHQSGGMEYSEMMYWDVVLNRRALSEPTLYRHLNDVINEKEGTHWKNTSQSTSHKPPKPSSTQPKQLPLDAQTSDSWLSWLKDSLTSSTS